MIPKTSRRERNLEFRDIVQWFGEHWGALICDIAEHVAKPQGCCFVCGRDFTDADAGVVIPYSGPNTEESMVAAHHHCFIESLGLRTKELTIEQLDVNMRILTADKLEPKPEYHSSILRRPNSIGKVLEIRHKVGFEPLVVVLHEGGEIGYYAAKELRLVYPSTTPQCAS